MIMESEERSERLPSSMSNAPFWSKAPAKSKEAILNVPAAAKSRRSILRPCFDFLRCGLAQTNPPGSRED
jgi:hypothetical protein